MKKNIGIFVLISILFLSSCSAKCEHKTTTLETSNYFEGNCVKKESWTESVCCSNCGELLSTNYIENDLKECSYQNGNCVVCGKSDKLYGYNQLNSAEKIIFDALVIGLKNNFGNYQSIRLEAAAGYFADSYNIKIMIKGNWYELYFKNFSGLLGFSVDKGYMYKCDTYYTPSNDISINKINIALDYYW